MSEFISGDDARLLFTLPDRGQWWVIVLADDGMDERIIRCILVTVYSAHSSGLCLTVMP